MDPISNAEVLLIPEIDDNTDSFPFKNPKSIYECDIFTISSNVCARILFQTYKKGTLNIVEYKEIINKLRLFINNINYKDKEQERIFNESLDLLNKIKKKNN